NLRHELTRLGLAEVKTLLETGEPARAVEAIGVLRDRGVNGGDLESLAEAARDWILAREQADRGEFSQALNTLERVRKLLPSVPAALAQWRTRVRDRQQPFADLQMRLHEAAQKERWQDVVRLAEELLAIAPQHVEARRLRSRAWKAIEPKTQIVPRKPAP